MGKSFTGAIGFGNKHLPCINRIYVFPDIRPLDEATSAIPAIDKVKCQLPDTPFLAPIIEIGRDTKRCVARYETHNRWFAFGKDFPKYAERTLISHQDIEFA